MKKKYGTKTKRVDSENVIGLSKSTPSTQDYFLKGIVCCLAALFLIISMIAIHKNALGVSLFLSLLSFWAFVLLLRPITNALFRIKIINQVPTLRKTWLIIIPIGCTSLSFLVLEKLGLETLNVSLVCNVLAWISVAITLVNLF